MIKLAKRLSFKGHAYRPACRTGRQAGFTLIELLIVVSIIGILAGLVLAIISPARQQARAKDAVLVATMNKIYAEIQIFANTDISGNSNYPDCATLVTSLQNAVSVCGGVPPYFTIKGVTVGTVGSPAGFKYTKDNSLSPKVFCLSAPANDTTSANYIKLDPTNLMYTPTRDANGCP